MSVNFISSLNSAAEKVSTFMSSSWLGREVTPYLDKLPTIHPLVKGAVVVGAVFTAVIVKCIQKHQETKKQEAKKQENKERDLISSNEIKEIKELNKKIHNQKSVIEKLTENCESLEDQAFKRQNEMNELQIQIKCLEDQNRVDNENLKTMITNYDQLKKENLEDQKSFKNQLEKQRLKLQGKYIPKIACLQKTIKELELKIKLIN